MHANLCWPSTIHAVVSVAWVKLFVRFADTRGCWSGHGLGSHIPYSILRFAQQPFALPDIAPVPLAWDIVGAYTAFFLSDYLTRFAATPSAAGLSKRALLGAIAADPDCTACVLSPSGWEIKHVREFLSQDQTTA
jgi:hypothetical protein